MVDEVVRVLSEALGLSSEQLYTGAYVSGYVLGGTVVPFIPRAARKSAMLCFFVLGACVSVFRSRPSELVKAVLDDLKGDAEWEPTTKILATGNLLVHEADPDAGTIGLVKCNGVELPELSPREHRLIARAATTRAWQLRRQRELDNIERARLKNEANKTRFISALRKV